MYSILTLTWTALTTALILTPLCRNFFLKLGIVDHPDQSRKLHSKPIPRVGGIAVFLAYVFAFVMLLVLPLKGGLIFGGRLALVLPLLPPVAVVFFTGLLDDLIGLKPWQKLSGQCAAACWVVAGGVRIGSLSGLPIQPWISAILTVLWLVACANALNLIDGLDGLASGVGLFGASTIFAAALLQHNFELALATAPLIGALLGFLRYNFSPASIFLGDCGSLTIGFLLGCFGVVWGQKSATALGMVAPAMALAVPILDTGLAIMRRFLRRKPIFSADRGHIHHRLLDRGLTPRRTVLLIYAACTCVAALSLVRSAFTERLGALVIVVFCALVCVAIQQLKYPELEVGSKLLAQGAFRDHLTAHITLRNLDRALGSAENALACWHAVKSASTQLGFRTVELYIAGNAFGDHPPADDHQIWSLYVPLSNGTDFIRLAREFECTVPIAVAPLSECLRRNFAAKALHFAPVADEAATSASLMALARATSSRGMQQLPVVSKTKSRETINA